MKKYLLAVIVTGFISSPVMAKHDCEQTAKIARLSMQAYQNGVPLNESLSLVSGGDAESDLYRVIINTAYETPYHKTTALKEAAMIVYKDQVMTLCIDKFGA